MTLILFDFDGVLADTLEDMLRFGQEVCDELGIKHVVKQADLSNLEFMSFAAYGRNCEVPEPLVEDFVRGCLKRFAEKKSPPDIFEGLGEVVKELSGKHVIAIVTGNTTQNVNAFLTEHGLSEHVRAVYGVDEPGSKAEKISKAQNQFAAGNEAVYMIGDSVSDIRAARQAGVQSIVVSWGHQSMEMLIKAEPDSIIHSPRELFELIR
jgi:phosphoglycolate phosphatase